jgi:hypothetical protein
MTGRGNRLPIGEGTDPVRDADTIVECVVLTIGAAQQGNGPALAALERIRKACSDFAESLMDGSN